MWDIARPWILAARPKTLPAALVPVWAGTVLAGRVGTAVEWLGWCTLLSATAIQVATNFFNDALDSKKGSDTEKRLGPERASASGLIDADVMVRAAWVSLGVAVMFSIPLVVERGWPIIAIGAVSMLCAYAYTGGPFPLAYRGMGEAFVIAFFGIVAVMGTVFVHTGEWVAEAALMGLQVGLLCAVLIAINNLRDQAEDERSRKFTLAVIFGQTFAEVEIALFCLLPLVMGVAWHFVFAWWEAMIYPLALLACRADHHWQGATQCAGAGLQPVPSALCGATGGLRRPDHPRCAMSEYFYWRYRLRLAGAGGLNARTPVGEIEGALLRHRDGGHACLQPWPTLGQGDLDASLALLCDGGDSPLLSAARRCIGADGAARRDGTSLFAGKIIPKSHLTVPRLGGLQLAREKKSGGVRTF